MDKINVMYLLKRSKLLCQNYYKFMTLIKSYAL